MLRHCATLSPVSLAPSVPVHGPAMPAPSPNWLYMSKPAFVPELPLLKLSPEGVIVPPPAVPIPTDVFDVPKAQRATPLSLRVRAEVSVTLLLPVAVPLPTGDR